MAASSLAARHPELSWDRLMGDAAWNEQTGRDFAERIIGKAAADPDLRDELDGILRDDYGQGAQTREQTRAKEEPTPEQEPQAKTAGRRPAGEEGKPKPIRSKKTLLERFKTRLNENLATQKNHQAPTQNRDRTPRKGR